MGAVEMTVAGKWLFAKIDELGIPVAITGTLAVGCDPNLFGGTLRGIGRRRQGTDSASLNGSRLSTTLPGRSPHPQSPPHRVALGAELRASPEQPASG
jgi:hypothetical protein